MYQTAATASVVIVGGPDVDARMDLMRYLRHRFDISALGSQPRLRERFNAEGFGYESYHLSRQVDPFSDLLTLRELVASFRRLRPQIVHTFDTKPGVWGRLAARLANVPVTIGTVTGLGSLYGSNGMASRIARAALQSLQKLACSVSDLTIFQNHDDARQLVAAGIVAEKKTRIIPGSGVATELFSPGRVSGEQRAGLRAELDIQPGQTVVTMVSRVIRTKGVLEFAAAAHLTGRRLPQVRFLLVGGEDQESVDRLTPEELTHVRRAVTWTGPRRDVATLLAISDVFVLPSAYREGVPRVLLEAASMALPIITTDSPGCNEVVADGLNGFLVPTRDPLALTVALERLVDQPALRRSFGQVSRQRALEYFDLSVICSQTSSIYQQLLEGKRILPAMGS